MVLKCPFYIYGKKHSSETIEKMRQAALNRKRKQERVGT